MTHSFRLTAGITTSAVLLAGGSYGWSVAKAESAATAVIARTSQTRAPHQPTRMVWAGVYTKEQATRGRLAYVQFCSRCHRDDLSGGEAGPPLTGASFFNRWNELTLLDVFAYIQSAMPHDHEVYVSADSARDIVSFLLQQSGIPAGDEELSKDIEKLADILITRPPPRK